MRRSRAAQYVRLAAHNYSPYVRPLHRRRQMIELLPVDLRRKEFSKQIVIVRLQLF